MNAEVQHLSHSFRLDAAFFIQKVEHANTPSAPFLRTPYIAKLVVDLYMACECSLKSQISSASTSKTGSEVFATILQFGHNLKRLLKAANPTNINADDKAFLRNAAKMGVTLRYSLDLFSLSASDLLPEEAITFRLDQDYLQRFMSIAKSLTNEANAKHKEAFGDGSSPLMSQKQVKEYVKKLRAVSKKAGKKCCR